LVIKYCSFVAEDLSLPAGSVCRFARRKPLLLNLDPDLQGVPQHEIDSGSLGYQYCAWNSSSDLIAASSDFMRIVAVWSVPQGQLVSSFAQHSVAPVLPVTFLPYKPGELHQSVSSSSSSCRRLAAAAAADDDHHHQLLPEGAAAAAAAAADRDRGRCGLDAACEQHEGVDGGSKEEVEEVEEVEEDGFFLEDPVAGGGPVCAGAEGPGAGVVADEDALATSGDVLVYAQSTEFMFAAEIVR
jgi:hypothetical protein